MVGCPFRRDLSCRAPVRIQLPATRDGTDNLHTQECTTFLLSPHRPTSGGARVGTDLSFGHFFAPISPVWFPLPGVVFIRLTVTFTGFGPCRGGRPSAERFRHRVLPSD